MKHRSIINYINQHFKVKLILSLSVIIILCSLVTGYVSYRINLNLFESEISRQYVQTSEQTMEQIGFKIQDIYRITDFVFFHPMVEEIVKGMNAVPKDGESEAYRNFMLERDLASILLPLKNETPQIRALYIVDQQGNNVYFSQAAASIQIKFPDFYTQIKGGMNPSSAEIVWQRTLIPDTSEPSGFKSTIVAARVLKSTKQQTEYGMIILILDESFFSNSLEPLLAGRTTGAYLYDQHGKLLYSKEAANAQGYEPQMLKAGMDGRLIRHIGNTDYLFVKSVYEPRSFTLTSGISLADLKAKGRSVYQLALISGLVSVALMAISVSFFSGKMLRPLHQLVRAMQRVREGNFRESIPKTSKDEFAFLADSFNKMVADIQALIQEVYVSKLSEKEAELKALQAQLNPHFLHNALNTIYWKIILLYEDAETASLVSSLSELLKYSLGTISAPSTLREELKQIRNYMTIQEARYGEELTVCLEVEEAILEGSMQRLLLQPLVENVFVHAFANQSEDKRLSIRASRVDSELRIEIEDNGCGMPDRVIAQLHDDRSIQDDRKERESIGIRNVMRRIHLVHGKPYGMDIRQLEQGTRIVLRLPFELEPPKEGETQHAHHVG
ncbi:histidine kinase [Paenibacillus oryzisoli]|uniref:sensor histidine kinase n=1 Tax=Paenibacillus oryzisoli TaxID=1850517 RepID=UPI003D2B257E